MKKFMLTLMAAFAVTMAVQAAETNSEVQAEQVTHNLTLAVDIHAGYATFVVWWDEAMLRGEEGVVTVRTPYGNQNLYILGQSSSNYGRISGDWGIYEFSIVGFTVEGSPVPYNWRYF